MRAPTVYAVSVLISIFMLPAAGYSQTGDARTAPEVTNSQDPTPQPSSSGERRATVTSPNPANSSGQSAPSKTPQLSGGGQRLSGTATGPSLGVPARPENPSADVLNPSGVSSSPQPGATVPQSALFEFLFNNISALDKVADSDDKAGNHTSAALWRTHDQRAAGLNDAEGQILQEIALDCLRMLKEQDAKFQVAAEKFRSQLKPGAPAQIPPDLAQMFEYRKKIVNEHIETLREALGDPSFNKLDTYVHSSFHAQVIVPKPTAPSLSTTEKSQKEMR